MLLKIFHFFFPHPKELIPSNDSYRINKQNLFLIPIRYIPEGLFLVYWYSVGKFLQIIIQTNLYELILKLKISEILRISFLNKEFFELISNLVFWVIFSIGILSVFVQIYKKIGIFVYKENDNIFISQIRFLESNLNIIALNTIAKVEIKQTPFQRIRNVASLKLYTSNMEVFEIRDQLNYKNLHFNLYNSSH
jgi:membrane protein YdbS with pleckstrin-like domain